MLDQRARTGAAKLADPVARGLARLGLTPFGATLGGLALTVLGAVALAGGRPLLGAVVILLGGVLDILDGALARVTGRPSRRGAVLDSVADRLGETAMWAGLAYHVAGRPAAVALCAVVLGNSMVISYLRAKAEAVGVEGRGGWMGRTERVLLYVVGVGTGWVWPMLWVMLALTGLTVGQRFRLLWTQLGD